MNKRIPPYETTSDDLAGIVTINFDETLDFNTFGAEFANYNPDRFEAVALRVFMETIPIVTLYAIDKDRLQSTKNEKLPVHKFKKEMPLEILFSRFKQFSFTVTTGDRAIENMEVINK